MAPEIEAANPAVRCLADGVMGIDRMAPESDQFLRKRLPLQRGFRLPRSIRVRWRNSSRKAPIDSKNHQHFGQLRS